MSMTFLCPAEIQSQANKLVQLLDPSYGPTNFSVPLSKTGEEPATYYGGHLAGGASAEFKAVIAAANAGIAPPGLEDALGEPPVPIFKKFIIREDTAFEDVLAEPKLKLKRITVDDV